MTTPEGKAILAAFVAERAIASAMCSDEKEAPDRIMEYKPRKKRMSPYERGGSGPRGIFRAYILAGKHLLPGWEWSAGGRGFGSRRVKEPQQMYAELERRCYRPIEVILDWFREDFPGDYYRMLNGEPPPRNVVEQRNWQRLCRPKPLRRLKRRDS